MKNDHYDILNDERPYYFIELKEEFTDEEIRALRPTRQEWERMQKALAKLSIDPEDNHSRHYVVTGTPAQFYALFLMAARV
jgi:hypothetical protein